MIGLDTNILVRYLAQDDPVQSPLATKIIEQQLDRDAPGFISLVTIVETVWVLGSVYRQSDTQIVKAIEGILAADTLTVQNEQEVFHAMIALKTGNGSFADALIGALSLWAGCPSILTFDRKAAKLSGFQLV